MKNLITFLLSCATSIIVAQVINPNVAQIAAPINPQPATSISFIEEAPNWSLMTANLNLAQSLSGVLLNKITDFANLTNFNTIEKNLSGKEHFYQAMAQLFTVKSQLPFVNKTDLDAKTAYSIADNSVDVGFINTSFERLNYNEENELLGGLKFINGQFVPIVGNPSFI